MNPGTLKIEEIRAFDVLTTVDKSRFICVCEIFLPDDFYVTQFGFNPRVIIKENGKSPVNVAIDVFKQQLDGGKLIRA